GRVLAQHRSFGEGSAVLRPRRPIPQRDLLSWRRAARAGGGLEGGGSKALQAADPDRYRGGRPVLQSRRVPSGLLREESRPLQILSVQLRTRRPARGAVGQEGLRP